MDHLLDNLENIFEEVDEQPKTVKVFAGIGTLLKPDFSFDPLSEAVWRELDNDCQLDVGAVTAKWDQEDLDQGYGTSFSGLFDSFYDSDETYILDDFKFDNIMKDMEELNNLEDPVHFMASQLETETDVTENFEIGFESDECTDFDIDEEKVKSTKRKLEENSGESTKMTLRPRRSNTSRTNYEVEEVSGPHPYDTRKKSKKLKATVVTSHLNFDEDEASQLKFSSSYEDPKYSSDKIGIYSQEERKCLIKKFLEKRKSRVWTKQIRYAVRKKFADSRLRVKGRFISKDDESQLREIVLIMM